MVWAGRQNKKKWVGNWPGFGHPDPILYFAADSKSRVNRNSKPDPPFPYKIHDFNKEFETRTVVSRKIFDFNRDLESGLGLLGAILMPSCPIWAARPG